MKKIALIVGALVALSATSAFAAGINLSWTDCGAAGTQNLTWACNANLNATAAPKLFAVGSFVPPASALPVVGIEATVHWTGEPGNLVAWWQFGTQWIDPSTQGPDGCRKTSLVPKFDASALAGACTDYFGPLTPVGGGLTYYGLPDARSGSIKMQVAAPFDQATALDASTEYYGFYLSIDKLKTTGATTCAGCSNPICLTLDYITLFYTDNSTANLTNSVNRNFISWQDPLPVDATCPLTTPVQSKTWGELKSLYR